jgi:hypothetical protein
VKTINNPLFFLFSVNYGKSGSMRRVGIVAIVFLSFLFVLTNSASATGITVCPSGCDYVTIQNAVGNASSGDTINVSAGTYDENITINKANLTLKSVDGASTTIIDANGRYATIVYIISNGVIFDGFTVQNASGVNEYGIWMNGVNGSTIKNSIIKNLIANTSYAVGLQMNNAYNNTISNITISNLSMTKLNAVNLGAFGIWSTSSSDNIFIDIAINGITSGSDAQGIMLYKGSNRNSFTGTTISALTTTGSGNSVYPVGITIYSGTSPCNNNTFTYTSISDLNTATNGWSAGIQVRGDSLANTGNIFTNTNINDIVSTGLAFGVAVTTGSSVTFDGGNIWGIDATTSARGFNIWKETSANSSATINNMTISVGIGEGVRIGAGVDSSFSNIHFCRITNNTIYGVRNLGINILNATLNFWGSATPNTSKISGNITYYPFCLNAGCSLNIDNETKEFTGNTTDFSNITDWSDVTLKLDAGEGTIEWGNNVDLTTSNLQFDNYIEISHRRISLNAPMMPELDHPATLTFKNAGYTDISHLSLKRNGITCPNDICSNKRIEGNSVLVDVNQMSDYWLEDSVLGSMPSITGQLVVSLGFGIMGLFAVLTLIYVSYEQDPETFIKIMVSILIIVLAIVAVWQGLVI